MKAPPPCELRDEDGLCRATHLGVLVRPIQHCEFMTYWELCPEGFVW